MKGINILKIAIILVVLLVSCKNETKSKGETVYNKENFKDSKKVFNFLGEDYLASKKTLLFKDMFYTAAILPKEYYVKKHLKVTDSLKFYLNKVKNEEVIQFDFQDIDQKDLFQRKYNGFGSKELIEFLSFGIKEQFYAITEKGEVIKPKGVFFERSFKLTPYKRILLYFDFKKEQSKIKLVYQDKIFNNQIFKFNLQK